MIKMHDVCKCGRKASQLSFSVTLHKLYLPAVAKCWLLKPGSSHPVRKTELFMFVIKYISLTFFFLIFLNEVYAS